MIDDILNAYGTFAGINLYSTPLIDRLGMVQFRFPKSKGKRIQKKWKNDRKNWRKDLNKTVLVNKGNIFMSPNLYELFKAFQPI